MKIYFLQSIKEIKRHPFGYYTFNYEDNGGKRKSGWGYRLLFMGFCVYSNYVHYIRNDGKWDKRYKINKV